MSDCESPPLNKFGNSRLPAMLAIASYISTYPNTAPHVIQEPIIRCLAMVACNDIAKQGASLTARNLVATVCKETATESTGLY